MKRILIITLILVLLLPGCYHGEPLEPTPEMDFLKEFFTVNKDGRLDAYRKAFYEGNYQPVVDAYYAGIAPYVEASALSEIQAADYLFLLDMSCTAFSDQWKTMELKTSYSCIIKSVLLALPVCIISVKCAERNKVRVILFHGYGPVVCRDNLGCICGGTEGYCLVYACVIKLLLKVCCSAWIRLPQLVVVSQMLYCFLCYLLVKDMCMNIYSARHRAIVIT